MPATPVLSNGGTTRGLPISCFLNEASDSLDGIVGALERECLAGRQGRRHRHLLGQPALHRREGRPQRQDLRRHPLHPRDGQPDAGDLPGLAAARLGRLLPAGQPPGDRGIPRDPPPDRRRPEPQGAEPAPRRADPRRLHARGRGRRGMGAAPARRTARCVRKVSARALWIRILDRADRDRRALPHLLRPREPRAGRSTTSWRGWR